MSLRSGIASLSARASRVARRALALGSVADGEVDSSESDDSVDGGSLDGGSRGGRTPKGSDAEEGDDASAADGSSDGPLGGVRVPSSRDPPDSKYDSISKDISGGAIKLDFSDVAVEKLVKALNPKIGATGLSRRLLPKLNYTKQIMVTQATFAAWVEQVKVYTYSRRWPHWCTSVGGSKTWDGVDDDSDESIARRECYEWMETSIPQESKYILVFIRKGDAKAVYDSLWKRFAVLTVKELQQKFWSLEMIEDRSASCSVCLYCQRRCS